MSLGAGMASFSRNRSIHLWRAAKVRRRKPALTIFFDEPVGLRLRFVLAASFLAFEDVVLSEFAQTDEGELGCVLALEGADAGL